MDNEKKKESSGEGTKDTLLTILGVFVYIVYRLAKGSINLLKGLWKHSIFTIVCTIGLIVLAIMLWPLTLTIIVTLAIIAFILFDPDMLG